MPVIPKTSREIAVMVEGGLILGRILGVLREKAVPGATPTQLDKFAEALVLESGAQPSFKGYQNFPAVICASRNEYIVHSVPDDKPLKDGDLLTIDLGIRYRGYHTDAAISFGIGQLNPEGQRLVTVCKKALARAVAIAKTGINIGTIGNVVQRLVEKNGFQVVRNLAGHGIGRDIHEPPMILNFGKRGEGESLPAGATICIEPMITAGGYELAKNPKTHGYYTKDKSLSCHFEHTVLITDKGGRILTPVPETAND